MSIMNHQKMNLTFQFKIFPMRPAIGYAPKIRNQPANTWAGSRYAKELIETTG